MKIELTNEQFRELLIDVAIGVWIRESVYEDRGEEFMHISELEDYLVGFADKFGASDMVEDSEGKPMLNEDTTSHLIEDVIDEWKDTEFWDELVMQLGQRDFFRTLTKKQMRDMEAKGEGFPESIRKFYEKYAYEFEKHGIGRLEIVEPKSE